MPPAVPPRAESFIPNARAGERFSSPVAIVLDEGQQATVRDVVFPRNIGLTFDKEHKLLTGTPTESGDIELSTLVMRFARRMRNKTAFYSRSRSEKPVEGGRATSRRFLP
ncbi:hypothetical protein ACLB1R_34905 [Escherichia coli]